MPPALKRMRKGFLSCKYRGRFGTVISGCETAQTRNRGLRGGKNGRKFHFLLLHKGAGVKQGCRVRVECGKLQEGWDFGALGDVFVQTKLSKSMAAAVSLEMGM